MDKKVKVKGVELENKKKQHLEVGKVYEVTEETAKILVDKKHAVKVK